MCAAAVAPRPCGRGPTAAWAAAWLALAPLLHGAAAIEVVALSAAGEAQREVVLGPGAVPLGGLSLLQVGFLRGTFGMGEPQDADFFGSFPQGEATDLGEADPAAGRGLARHRDTDAAEVASRPTAVDSELRAAGEGTEDIGLPLGSFEDFNETGRRRGRGLLWTERSVNTTLECERSGCTAVVSLQAYNPAVERARNCKLSVYFHPTDFDDRYSGERVRFVKVNGVTVQDDCFPMASGCNVSRAMFACTRDVPVDGMINAGGSLEVSAAISEEVDECPYNGNMLSAVPMISCLIAPVPEGSNETNETDVFEDYYGEEERLEDAEGNLSTTAPPKHRRRGTEAVAEEWPEEPTEAPEPLPPTPPALPAFPLVPEAMAQPTTLALNTVFRCPARGCTAGADFRVNQTALPFKRCLLTVHVSQTDFDDGATEKLEFIKVNGAVVASDIRPGLNPCQSEYLGEEPGRETFTALRHEDVTKAVKESSDGHLRLQVKISNLVDECAHEGYLLSGEAQLRCSFGTPDNQPEEAEQERLHLDGLASP